MNTPLLGMCSAGLLLFASHSLACSPAQPSEPGSASQSKHSQQSLAQPEPSLAAAGLDVAIEPYILHLTDSSVQLVWRAIDPVANELTLVSLHTGESKTFPGTDTKQQSVIAEGLPPGTDFRWEIKNKANGSVTWSGSFRTLPLESNRRFAVVGHTHGSEHFGHYSDHLLAARIAEASPQFLIHTGDCVYYSTPKGWRTDFFDVFRPVLRHAPIYISPGNHDSGWPFLDGMDLRIFQQLFPHPFADGNQGKPGAAYYDRVQGPVRFLFLSYVTDLAEGSPQHGWIRKTLRDSTSEFNVVVLGGMNNYYDKPALRALLSSERVDAVLRGDGSAPALVHSHPTNYPILTLGTANHQPHPWLDASATPERLVFREMDATGKAKAVHWIHSKRERPAIHTLPEPTPNPLKGQIMLRYMLSPAISSEDVNGLQFKIEGISDKKLTYYVTTLPKTKLARGEPGFRSQYHSLSATDNLAAAPIPAQRPMRGGAYEIKEVRLKLIGTDAHPDLKVTAAWLY